MTHLYQVMKDNVNGATFVSLDTTTQVKLLGGKKNMFQNRVTKVTKGIHVMVFQNKKQNGYDNMVKRRLTKEGKNPDNFVLSPRTWGVRLQDQPFVEHKGQMYLEVIALRSGTSHYEVDGVVTNPMLIEGMPTTPEKPKQGGLDESVVIRTFKMASIDKVVINKQEFTNIQY